MSNNALESLLTSRSLRSASGHVYAASSVFGDGSGESPSIMRESVGDFPRAMDYPAFSTEPSPQSPAIQPEQPREVTVVLELDRQQLARAVYKLNDEASRRVGARLTGGID